MIVYVFSLSNLETVLAQTVVGRLNGEPKTSLLSSISKAACLILIVYCLQAEICLRLYMFLK